MNQQFIAGSLLVLLGVLVVLFRGPVSSYLYAMYPPEMQPSRELLPWIVVTGGVVAIAFGTALALGLW